MDVITKKRILSKIHAINEIEKIQRKTHYKEIMKLVKKDNIKYTTNKYGYWIDLNKLSLECLMQIETYMNEHDL
uniref:NET domain-containing protein n=1 Tax=Megaviridae environmental sample TaxID=1737588 RepID=A0A5J6VI39_9VIRU|nr:MAG: hypothetical protein [Megaviridae environmental sample]